MADQLVTPLELASYLESDLDASTANLLINLATAKVQEAAGQRLIDTTSTVVLSVDLGNFDPWLDLPQWPVRSVATVKVEGVTITDWLLRGQRIWRLLGWWTGAAAPTQVTVTYSSGYVTGAQGLELARDFTLALAAAGYLNPGGTATSEQIDDYRVTYAQASDRMTVSPGMRDQLQAAYGAGAWVVTSATY